jgi:exodeoxyribonuclease X
MKLKEILFLDSETTQKKDGRLVQLATMKFGEVKPYVVTYKPAEPISIEAMVVHGITNEDVAGLLPFSFSDVEKDIVKNSIVVAHNAPFDISVMGREGVPVGRFIDTLKVAHTLIDSPSYSLQYLRYYLGLKVPKGAVAHDAGGDVIVLSLLFKYLYALMTGRMKGETGIDPTEDAVLSNMVEISSKPMLMKTMVFGKYKGETFETIKKIDKEYLEWVLGLPDLTEDLIYTINKHLN